LKLPRILSRRALTFIPAMPSFLRVAFLCYIELFAVQGLRRKSKSSTANTMAYNVSSSTTNPFAAHSYYMNPVNVEQYDQSIDTASNPLVRANLLTMKEIASAYWIDRKDKITGNTTRTVEGILADAASKSPAELVVLIWYDFPNRDCAAAASMGEICCAYLPNGRCDWGNGGDCAAGIEEYKTTYVDPFVQVLVEYKGRVPVVIVYEPDSLPNFATNLGRPNCAALETRNAYAQGATYALTELTSKTDATVYVDAAHGGWLGWHNNMLKFMDELKGLDVPWNKIRGFSTNVAGYQPLGQMCPWEPDSQTEPYRNGYCLNGKNSGDSCCEDPCDLLGQWNPGNNEQNYAQMLRLAAQGELGMDAHVIIDTGRNGVPGPRSDSANWCNIRNAGAGHASTASVPDIEVLDAFFYLKTPGESDGCTQDLPGGGQCPRFDVMCGSSDSIGSSPGEPRAPEAGGWFDYQVKQLAEFANFESSFPPAPVPTPAPSTPPRRRSSTPPRRRTSTPSRRRSGGGECSPVYGQCGGNNWSGPTCCEDGSTCQTGNEWYSQCTPSR